MAEPIGELEVGSIGEVAITVDPTMTAAVFAQGEDESFPDVLATPFMIGAMERACASLMAPLCALGTLSVGAKVEVAHFAPTPVGAMVRAFGKFAGREGALFWFDVWAEDEGGKIGKGRHARAFAEADAIVAKAEERMKK
ncbi:thioesterase family protein [Tianweitania sediminis]|uniref:Thioesterase n=1 Tax=Tianweitania sediminis TaxID=1502156 RepID=A0A8J7UK33_9HYPH|nr:thioesterase [Tianweitania sediminis]MBP0440703.1 thioesterase [Tianweitania sediminis]